jgi:predicted transcriptional regulator
VVIYDEISISGLIFYSLFISGLLLRKRGFPLSKKRYKFDGLAEFVSRRARIKLLELLREHGMPNDKIARSVGVTSRSVRHWLDPKKAHPSNEHLDRLIELSLGVNRTHTFLILNQEVEDFRRLLNELNTSSTTQIGKIKSGSASKLL